MSERTPRPLTNDERKAAEAAFQGEPFNEDWSQSAREMYEGISAFLTLRAMGGRDSATDAHPLVTAHS
ncbi:hypothetical protein YTPLAS18_04030 [Nitrospira sp.]|nr:hypothetical protein YTPLAS18_04030 [Nitrospira sp.]